MSIKENKNKENNKNYLESENLKKLKKVYSEFENKKIQITIEDDITITKELELLSILDETKNLDLKNWLREKIKQIISKKFNLN